MLVYAIECACFEFISKNKTFPGDLENRKNDGNGTTNKKTSTERNETETIENENQNDVNR